MTPGKRNESKRHSLSALSFFLFSFFLLGTGNLYKKQLTRAQSRASG
jgi:hypothetical protein